MSEENAQKKNKFRPVVFGCLIPSAGFLVLAIIAALLLSRAEPPGKKPEYIKSAEPRIEQRISNVEKKILEHASDSYDPDTTVMALFSMETAIRNAGNFEQLTEYINRGQDYDYIRKIYSVNIVYFNLGNGTDVVYHGKTEFRGIHNGELLSLSPFQQQKFNVSTVSDLYPEYYILKVNDFNRWSKVPLEQWIYFLNTGDIPSDATAPGLHEAREKLRLERMSKAELNAYYRHLDNVVVLRDNIVTARGEGRMEGRMEEKLEVAKNLKQLGISMDAIAQATGLSLEEIEHL